MKLSNLLYLREQLDEQRPMQIDDRFRKLLDPFMHFLHTNAIQAPDLIGNLRLSYDRIFGELITFDTGVTALRNHIDTLIAETRPKYLSDSYSLYEDEMRRDPVPIILHRRPTLTEEMHDFVLGRILRFSDWQRSGLIIRPGLEEWTSKLVGLDPLYLVDENYELLNPCITRFNPKYQSRLRPYMVKEFPEARIQLGLPEGQIGYCLAYNFFHYKPIELIRTYLAELYRFMEPGATLHMSINDCDRSGGVVMVERAFMCYTPASMIIAAAEGTGFQHGLSQHLDAANTWLEFQKPGHRVSLRGGQSLAKVVDTNRPIA